MGKNKAKRDKALFLELRNLTMREAMELVKIIRRLKDKIAPIAHGTSRVTDMKKVEKNHVHKLIEEGRK